MVVLRGRRGKGDGAGVEVGFPLACFAFLSGGTSLLAIIYNATTKWK